MGSFMLSEERLQTAFLQKKRLNSALFTHETDDCSYSKRMS